MTRAPIGSAGAGAGGARERNQSTDADGPVTVVDDRCPECGHEASARSEWRVDVGRCGTDAWRCPNCEVPVAVDDRREGRR